MIRRSLFQVFFTLLLLGTHAMPLDAACAWILWTKITTMYSVDALMKGTKNIKGDWTVSRVLDSKPQCEDMLKSFVRIQLEGSSDPSWTKSDVIGGDTGLVTYKSHEGSYLSYHFLCTPDTIDPRDTTPR